MPPGAARPLGSAPPFVVRLLDESTWPAFAELVEANNGVWGGCWCTAFHARPGEERTAAQKRADELGRVRAGETHNALVLDGPACVGWCRFGTPAEVPRVKSSRRYAKGLVRLPDWRITCFFTGKGQRRRGVAHAAPGGALAEIARAGGGVVEGYPEETDDRTVSGSFLHTGPVAVFEAHGFTRTRAVSPHRWVVTRTIDPAREDVGTARGRALSWCHARAVASGGGDGEAHAAHVQPAFAAHTVPRPLRRWVVSAYGYRAPAMPTGLHRGLPSPYLTLVVELRAPLRVTIAARPVAAHGVVGGLHCSPALIDASAPQEGVQLALTPIGARALLGVPAAELRSLAVDLADVFGPGADVLVERLRDAPTWSERFALLDDLLLRRVARAGDVEVAPEVRAAWRLLIGSSGRARVGEVAADVGWSRRHLSERFRAETGLTPKEAARIARFAATRGALLARAVRPPSGVHSGGTLAEVAARCGFADQAHLAHEWRAFSGCSVSTWLSEELPFLQDGAVTAGAGSSA